MESVKPSAVAPTKSKLARTFAKVLHIRTTTVIAPVDGVHKVKSQAKVSFGKRNEKDLSDSLDKLDEEFERRLTLEAILAKLFATVSSLKAAYAELQHAQVPYDPEGIQSSDQSIITELKALSELKQCFLKKQIDPCPGNTLLSAEIQEQKSLLKTYEIMGKKLESRLKLKDSEIVFLREKLEESDKQNRLLEKRMNQSGLLFVFDDLAPTHFVSVLRHTVKSIRSFVRLMIQEMKSAGWNIESAANTIEPGVSYYKPDDKCFAFEHFVCREMFDGFHHPTFSQSNRNHVKNGNKKQQQQLFFQTFAALKSMKAKEILAMNPKSEFTSFCQTKYLKLVHPKMEASFFGHLNQRESVISGENLYPETEFFGSFAEMAKRVWLLHNLAFSFETEASIFQVPKGCRFSEVYMESVSDEAFLVSNNTLDTEPRVAFPVIPGFRLGETVIQCQVYLSQFRTMPNN